MSFSQNHILRGIFSSSFLLSQTSKLPLNLRAQFIMLKPFSQGLVISRLISLKLSPLQASALIPSSPFIQSHLPSLPSSDPSASQPMLITSKLIVFTFSTLHNFYFFFLSTSPSFHFHPGPPQVSQEAICSWLSSNLISEFLVYARNLIRPQYSTRSDPCIICLWVSLALPHFKTLK